MNKEDLILQKLDELTTDVKEIKERVEKQQVEYTGLRGELRMLTQRFDDYITNAREQKTDKNSRWTIGGIIASATLSVLAIISAILIAIFK